MRLARPSFAPLLPLLAWASAAAAQPPEAGPVRTAPADAAAPAPTAPSQQEQAQEEAKAAASEQDVATVAALQAMHACLDGQVKAADDRVSPPEQIALKIKDACRAEQDRFLAAFRVFAAQHPRMEAPPQQISDTDRLAAATAAVIEARRESR